MTKQRPRRKSNSFPPQFMRILLHVADSQTPLRVDNLGNERRFYTSFRARINEFRSAYQREALMSDEAAKINLADRLYSVSLQDPQCIEGRWGITLYPREHIFASAIDDLIPEQKFGEVPVEREAKTKTDDTSHMSTTLSELYGSDDEDEDQ